MFVPGWLVGVVGTLLVEVLLVIGITIWMSGRNDTE